MTDTKRFLWSKTPILPNWSVRQSYSAEPERNPNKNRISHEILSDSITSQAHNYGTYGILVQISFDYTPCILYNLTQIALRETEFKVDVIVQSIFASSGIF